MHDVVRNNPMMPYKTVGCRHGKFSYFNDDELIGLSLQVYGEYSEGECVVFKNCIRPGDVVMDVGANLGAFTVPISKIVGDTGKVYGYEASPDNLWLLHKNLSDNDCNNVEVLPYAASDHDGVVTVSNQDAMHAYSNPRINDGRFEVPCRKIDDLNIEKLAFIKIDVDRHELAVLHGAEETIMRCFPAGTRVRPIGKIKKLYRRWYEGPLMTLITRGGRKLSGTPNHPIFTPQGETAIKDFKIGDYLLCASLADGLADGDSSNGTPDIDNKPSTIDEIFETFSNTFRPERVSGTALDFHGDGMPDGDVHIIRPDCILRHDRKRTVQPEKRLYELFLSAAYELLRPATLTGLGGLSQHSGPVATSMHASAPLFFGMCLHPDRRALRLSSDLLLMVLQHLHNGVFANTEIFRNLWRTFSRQITLDNFLLRKVSSTATGGPFVLPEFGPLSQFYARPDQEFSDRNSIGASQLSQFSQGDTPAVEVDEIVAIETDRDWAGHVYNLETESGKYVAEEIVSSNCNPIIYVENEAPEQAVALIAWLADHGYRCYWHRPFHFNPNNFNGEQKNIFGVLVSIMMICLPDPNTKNWDVKEVRQWDMQGLDEVADIRNDDQMFNREIERYTKIYKQFPDDLMARLLAAMYLNLMQRCDESNELIEENLRRKPDHKPTLNIKGLHLLQQGKWHEGWPLYELRFFQKNTSQFGGNRMHLSSQPDPRLNPVQEIPMWDGKPTDEVVLCWCEQGYGDQIMNARFFRQMKKLAPNAILEVSPELFELYDYKESRKLLGLPQLGHLFRLRRALPKYTKQCSIGSLPTILDVGEAEIKVDGAYLDADPMITQNWEGTGNHPYAFGVHPMNNTSVGLCTIGSPRSERPYTRNLPSQMVARLLKHGPFFSLEASHGFDSYACTAGAMKALKLVITVDTSMAHLAGALGVPVWLLLAWDPDFRWGLHGETTVWYNSMRIFRQPRFRDWTSVIDRVIAELELFKL